MSPTLAGVPAWREVAVSDWGGNGATQDLEQSHRSFLAIFFLLFFSQP